jgi:hypothetical protein
MTPHPLGFEFVIQWLEKEENPNLCSVRLLEDGIDRGYIVEGFKTDKHDDRFGNY